MMTDELRLVVDADAADSRFDRVVAAAAGISRAEARSLVERERALLDGEPAAPATRVRVGATIVVRPGARHEALEAAAVPFRIVTAAADFLVIDKPAGVVVHPGAGHRNDTLVNGLVTDYPELRSIGPERNWGLVHRLDRDTSGLLIVARTASAQDRLQADLRAKRVTRRYLALASDRVFDHATGTIEAPLARDPARPTRMAVVPGGKPSRTHYERLARWDRYTLLEVTLDTGRTHQIRVHLSAIGAPLHGDRVYGGRPTGLTPERVWLHAHRLEFPDPKEGGNVVVDSPLPTELQRLLDALGPPLEGSTPAP